jgi:hypothetical protein
VCVAVNAFSHELHKACTKLPSEHLCYKSWVHFNNEVHLGEKMDHPYVGIRKNHMDQIKMDKKVNLAKMDFLSILFVGHFAPALVIDSVETVIYKSHRSHPYTTTLFG